MGGCSGIRKRIRKRFQLAPLGDELLGHREELTPCRRELGQPSTALQKRNAQTFFERCELRRECRLCDSKSISRAADRLGFCNRLKILDLFEGCDETAAPSLYS